MLNTQFFSALWLDQNNGNKKMEFDDVNKYNWIMVDALIVKQPPLPMKFWRDSCRYVHSIHVMFLWVWTLWETFGTIEVHN